MVIVGTNNTEHYSMYTRKEEKHICIQKKNRILGL